MLVLLEIASATPSGSPAPLRCGREIHPEAGFNQERFLGGRRKAVERTVLEAEKT